MTPEEMTTLINEDRYSKAKRHARKGQDYYEGKHEILDYQIYFIDADGNLQRDYQRSNVRVSHPFFTELVDQEVQYLLSGGIKVESEDGDLAELVQAYFDEEFTAEMSELIEGAVIKGWDYLVAYKDAAGKTRFTHTDSLGVIEIKDGTNDTVTDAFLYYYPVKTEKKRPALRVEYWDQHTTTYYLYSDGSMVKDPNIYPNPRPHVLYDIGDSYEVGELGYLPLFRLDNNKKRISGLAPIKDLIDDYDLMDCGLSNNIQDAAESIYVIKGYKPVGGRTLDDLIFNLKQKKQIAVGEKGDVDIKTVDIPYEARKIKAEQDEKNIYRFGMGFNSSQVGDGNITNIVIKSRYFLLDLKCNKMLIRVQRLLKQLLKVVLDEINDLHGTAYKASDIRFVLDREVMTNAADNAEIEEKEAMTKQTLINMILSVADYLPDETVIRKICDVLDIDWDDIADKLPDPDISVEQVTASMSEEDDEEVREGSREESSAE
ncbi:MAG: phage portal protein [Lachnospiraceae bacterium]|nr:phage portal protein [Lachnospiraceae bacterium]MBR1567543.1 phage portal protein [Lachnospiraceae bacterium]MBR1568699.1 phage portal protein [Lachnospiraceae bacterium]